MAIQKESMVSEARTVAADDQKDASCYLCVPCLRHDLLVAFSFFCVGKLAS
jgi:hypothetical protein